MINKKFKKELKKIVTTYYKKGYTSSVDYFDMLKEEFGAEILNKQQKYQLKKFMLLFF